MKIYTIIKLYKFLSKILMVNKFIILITLDIKTYH